MLAIVMFGGQVWVGQGARSTCRPTPDDGEKAFPDFAEISLIAVILFPVRARRESASTGADLLRNPSQSDTETDQNRRSSLYFPGDQGIGRGDGFAMDSLLRHQVLVSGALALGTFVIRNNVANSRGLGDSGLRDPN